MMMMAMTKKYSLFFCLLMLSASLLSQSLVEVSLSSNPVLIEKFAENAERGTRAGGSVYDTLTLGINGFVEDFSNPGPYPDTALWLDDKVFINRTMAIAPPNLGIATFDGLNANGYPYNFAVSEASKGRADTLTSKPINLNFIASDSVYFSFFYQVQGRGNSPAPGDSLVLEFKNPSQTINPWKHIWARRGSSFSAADSNFKLVMIKVDTAFLKKGFQFRFTNWATLSGNLDHWNIDVVYLNRYRTITDTSSQDAAFVYNTPSLINTYTAVPWKQYNPSMMKTSYSTTIRNNNAVVINGSFAYKIYDESNIQVNTTYSGGSFNIDPYIPNGYMNYPAFTAPPLNYTIPLLTGNVRYTMESVLTANSNNIIKRNDTVRYEQVFSNYYAYDDGTAEVAIGVEAFNQAQLAQKFTTTVADTLRCIDIYFNPMLINASLYSINYRVWSDAGGVPGTALFSSANITPSYNQTGHNKFTRYYLPTPLSVSAGATFYIGFKQNTDQLVNVGFDKSINNQTKIFVKTSGAWQTSTIAGTLMMRPVFGSAADFLGVDDIRENNKSFSIYPNPANDKLFIKTNVVNSDNIFFMIMDLSGRTVLENNSSIPESIDVSALSNGIYFIKIISDTSVSTHKFIISR